MTYFKSGPISRRQLIRYAALSGVVSLAGCSSSPITNSQTEVKMEPLNAETIEQKIFDVVNLERQTRGIEPLILDGERSSFAREHSQDMVQKGYLSTTDANGNDPSERVRTAHGFEYISIPLDNGRHRITGISENIGKLPPEGTNSATADAFVNFWMGEQESRRTMLDKYYDHDLVGIGCVEGNGQYVCTQDLYRLTTKKKSVKATPKPTPTATPEPTPTATPEPTPTATPEPTPTRTPNATDGCSFATGSLFKTETESIRRKMVEYINDERRKRGLNMVLCDQNLMNAAQRTSEKMASVGVDRGKSMYGNAKAAFGMHQRLTQSSSGATRNSSANTPSYVANKFVVRMWMDPSKASSNVDTVLSPYIQYCGVGVEYSAGKMMYFGTLYSL